MSETPSPQRHGETASPQRHGETASPQRHDATVSPLRVLLVGGTSEIGLAILGALAAEQPIDALLLGRDQGRLEQSAASLRAIGCERVQTLAGLDAADPEGHEALLHDAFERLSDVDLAVIAVGLLGAKGGLPQDIAGALEVIDVTFRGAASLLMRIAARMRDRGAGTIVVLSSVAAERPRRANAVYGAAKAGIDALSQALSDALACDGVKVLVVRPGFVRTKMTRGERPAPLACNPQDVAIATVCALRRSVQTVWVPPALRWVMLAARVIPRPLFRRLSL